MDDPTPIDLNDQAAPRHPATPWPPLWKLLVKPGTFLPWAAFHMPTGLFFVVLYVVTIGRFIDRASVKIMQGHFAETFNTWPRFWALAVLLPIISMIFVYGIAGFFYWIRLLLCGVDAPGTFRRGARVLFCANLIYTVPVIAIQLYETVVYASPTASVSDETTDDAILYLALAATIYWSVACSWHGVLATFRPKRRAVAHLLFLILPIIFYTAFLSLGIVLTYINVFVPAPQIEQPRTHAGASFTLQYPSNWNVDTEWQLHDHDSSIFLETGADSGIRIEAYWTDATHDAILTHARERTSDSATSRGRSRTVRINDLPATNWEGTLTVEGTAYDVDQYVIDPEGDGWTLEIFTIAHPNAPKFDRAVTLVTDTIRWTHPREQASVTERTRHYEAAGVAFDYANNWSVSAEFRAPEDEQGPDIGTIDINTPWDSFASVLLYHSSEDPLVEIDITMDNYAENGAAIANDRRIESLGTLTGQGLAAELTYESGNTWDVRVFVKRLPDGRTLELREFLIRDRIDLDAPGFELLWNSLSVPEREPGLLPGTNR